MLHMSWSWRALAVLGIALILHDVAETAMVETAESETAVIETAESGDGCDQDGRKRDG